jgi:hypothetical protein
MFLKHCCVSLSIERIHSREENWSLELCRLRIVCFCVVRQSTEFSRTGEDSLLDFMLDRKHREASLDERESFVILKCSAKRLNDRKSDLFAEVDRRSKLDEVKRSTIKEVFFLGFFCEVVFWIVAPALLRTICTRWDGMRRSVTKVFRCWNGIVELFFASCFNADATEIDVIQLHSATEEVTTTSSKKSAEVSAKLFVEKFLILIVLKLVLIEMIRRFGAEKIHQEESEDSLHVPRRYFFEDGIDSLDASN